MRKRLKGISFAVALVLLLASTVTALAEDRKGAPGWQVAFDGSRMESNFSTANMTEEVNAMQPGDSVELTVTLKNDYSGQADWYMKNEVLQSLEDAGDAAGGAYDYLLTYTDSKGQTTTLYSSQKFGGEGRIGGVGLHGATTSLEDYFFLERMENGQSGVVRLKVALDGETLVNDYQNTLARLQMDFATELPTARTTTNPPGLRPNRTAVRTGDDIEIVRYLILMCASGAALLIGGIIMLRRQQEEDAGEGPAAAEAGGKARQRGK